MPRRSPLRNVWRLCISGFSVAVLVARLPATVAARPAREEVQVGQNLPVTATDLSVAAANNSPVLAEDPTEPRFVALAGRLDAPDFGCALHLSGDGGRYWTPAQPVPKLPEGAEKCYGPELAFDPEGNLLFLFVGLQGPGNSPMGAFLTTSSDRGRTFGPARPIVDGSGKRIIGEYNYMVRMAIDPGAGPRGRIHLAWLHVLSPPPTGGLPDEGNPILASHSDDGGRTFSNPVRVSDAHRRRAVAPALAAGGGGRVHVAYYDLHEDVIDYRGLEGPAWEGNWSLVTSTSTDGGKRFAPGVVADRKVVPPGRVMLIFTMPPPALAAADDRVFTAWPDARRGDPDIFFRRSSNGGRSWEEPRRLNDDPSGNGKDQTLPRVGVAPNGRVDAVFQDRRDDPGNTFAHVLYAFSDDGGRRFSANRKVTSRPSDTRIGRTYPPIASAQGLVEPGSRLGLLSRPSQALAAWPDARYGAVDRRQEIYSSTIALAEGAQPGSLPVWLIAVVLGGGIGVAIWAWALNRRTPPGRIQEGQAAQSNRRHP